MKRPKKGTFVSRPTPQSTAAVLEEPLLSDNPLPPQDWRKGALLNVRNRGPEYVVTLYPEEFDPDRPERAIHFTNIGCCQDFVSAWYTRESPDPRAIR